MNQIALLGMFLLALTVCEFANSAKCADWMPTAERKWAEEDILFPPKTIALLKSKLENLRTSYETLKPESLKFQDPRTRALYEYTLVSIFRARLLDIIAASDISAASKSALDAFFSKNARDSKLSSIRSKVLDQIFGKDILVDLNPTGISASVKADIFDIGELVHRKKLTREQNLDLLDTFLKARTVMGDFGTKDFEAIYRAHLVRPDRPDKGFSFGALRRKREILLSSGISPAKVEKLIRDGVVGPDTFKRQSQTAADLAPAVSVYQVGETLSIEGKSFENTQAWVVKNTTREDLLEAVNSGKLTVTGGRYAIYGESKMMRTETPPHLQNVGGRVEALGTRPAILPKELGSTAFVKPLPDGTLEVGMKDGFIGSGGSRIVIGETRYVKGVAETPIFEASGKYSLSINGNDPISKLAKFALEYSPPGIILKELAHSIMGSLHNAVFDVATPLANIVSDLRSERRAKVVEAPSTSVPVVRWQVDGTWTPDPLGKTSILAPSNVGPNWAWEVKKNEPLEKNQIVTKSSRQEAKASNVSSPPPKVYRFNGALITEARYREEIKKARAQADEEEASAMAMSSLFTAVGSNGKPISEGIFSSLTNIQLRNEILRQSLTRFLEKISKRGYRPPQWAEATSYYPQREFVSIIDSFFEVEGHKIKGPRLNLGAQPTLFELNRFLITRVQALRAYVGGNEPTYSLPLSKDYVQSERELESEIEKLMKDYTGQSFSNSQGISVRERIQQLMVAAGVDLKAAVREANNLVAELGGNGTPLRPEKTAYEVRFNELLLRARINDGNLYSDDYLAVASIRDDGTVWLQQMRYISSSAKYLARFKPYAVSKETALEIFEALERKDTVRASQLLSDARKNYFLERDAEIARTFRGRLNKLLCRRGPKGAVGMVSVYGPSANDGTLFSDAYLTVVDIREGKVWLDRMRYRSASSKYFADGSPYSVDIEIAQKVADLLESDIGDPQRNLSEASETLKSAREKYFASKNN